MSNLIANVQTPDRVINQLQQNIQQVVNPIAGNPIVNGVLLMNVVLTTGSNTIEHGLDRAYQGWMITGMHNAFTQLYDTPSPQPTLFLVLNSSVATSVDIYIF